MPQKPPHNAHLVLVGAPQRLEDGLHLVVRLHVRAHEPHELRGGKRDREVSEYEQ